MLKEETCDLCGIHKKEVSERETNTLIEGEVRIIRICRSCNDDVANDFIKIKRGKL